MTKQEKRLSARPRRNTRRRYAYMHVKTLLDNNYDDLRIFTVLDTVNSRLYIIIPKQPYCAINIHNYGCICRSPNRGHSAGHISFV